MGALLAVGSLAQAQTVTTGVWQDALRFTEQNPNYSSRMMGVGGAQVGLGADISNAFTNPAGLGMLRRSEVSLSPSILFTRSENESMGNNATAGSSRFHIGNLGVAFAKTKNEIDASGGFRGGAFAISVSRMANFNSRRNFSGISPYAPRPEDYGKPSGSQLTQSDSLLPGRNSYNYTYLDILSNYTIDPRITQIRSTDPEFSQLDPVSYMIRQAYGVFVLDLDSNTNKFYVTAPNGDVRQSGEIVTRGKAQQVDFAYGANFNDKFYLGGGIGIPIIDYNQYIVYDEELVKVVTPQSLRANGTDFSFWEGFRTRRQIDQTTSGVGINAKIGAIYKVTDFLRVGASVQTPSAMKVTNDYSTILSADFHNTSGQEINVYYPTADYKPGKIDGVRDRIYRTEYSVTSPWKLSAGASLLSGQYGVISAEVTYLNYPMSSLKGSDFNMSGDRDQLRKQSKSVLQVRAGGEYRYDIWRFRAGGGLLPDPFKSGKDMAFFSGGAGVRLEDYYFDLGFQRYMQKQGYQVYNGSESLFETTPVTSTLKNTLVQLTLGTYF